MTLTSLSRSALDAGHSGVRRLRVLQVIGSMHIGGAESVVAHLTRGLDRDRFEVAVCCTKQLGIVAEGLRDDGHTVLLAEGGGGLRKYLKPMFLHRVIGEWAPDVVHSHGTTAVLHAGPLALARALPPWVHTFHFGNYDALSGRQVTAEKLLCRQADQLVAVADRQRESVIRRHALHPGRIVTIVNGVLPNPFQADASVSHRRRAEFGIGPDETIVGTIAVLSEQKGISHLLDAARMVIECRPGTRFLIVGGGRLEGELRARAASMGLGSQVVFTGWRQDAAELLMTLNVFVMSSLWEAMPMVLLEAMAARRAIVVTDVGDNRGVVAYGRAGLVVPPGDGAALARAILVVLATPRLAESLAAEAEREYRRRYSVNAMLTAYDGLYMRLAGPRREFRYGAVARA
jgi:glycosyltransferase involved in cell wall biosynthesis